MATVATSNNIESLKQVVAQNVRNRRQALSMTQAQLAESAGCKREQITQIERGNSGFTLATMASLADALDCEVYQLWVSGMFPAV